jgi:hypothetical protein
MLPRLRESVKGKHPAVLAIGALFGGCASSVAGVPHDASGDLAVVADAGLRCGESHESLGLGCIDPCRCDSLHMELCESRALSLTDAGYSYGQCAVVVGGLACARADQCTYPCDPATQCLPVCTCGTEPACGSGEACVAETPGATPHCVCIVPLP